MQPKEEVAFQVGRMNNRKRQGRKAHLRKVRAPPASGRANSDEILFFSQSNEGRKGFKLFKEGKDCQSIRNLHVE